MKKYTLKASILAMSAALPGISMAALNLDTGAGNGGIYAAEINIATNVDLLDGAAADHTATTAFGASFAADAVAYVRVDLTNGTWTAAVDAADFAVNDNVGAASVNVSQGGAIGDDYVIFSVAPGGAGQNLVGSNIATFDLGLGAGMGVKVTNKNGVDIQYRLYETLTNAANETLDLKSVAGTSWLSFANAISITAGANQASVADVAADPAYTLFTGTDASNPVALFTVTHTARALTSGAASTVGDILADTNDLAITGDFSWAVDVELNAAAGCPGGGIDADVGFDGTGASFTGVSAANMVLNAWYVCATADTTTPIPAGSYTGAIDLDGQAGYTPTDGATGTGEITRNGTVYNINYMTTYSGYNQRIYLTNEGSEAVPYAITFTPEAGVTVTAGIDATGIIPAGETIVLKAVDVATISGGTRTAAKVTVNGQNTVIRGATQSVNLSDGTTDTVYLQNANNIL